MKWNPSNYMQKKELILSIKTLCDAITTGNQILINFADSQLGAILNNLPDDLPLLEKSENKNISVEE